MTEASTQTQPKPHVDIEWQFLVALRRAIELHGELTSGSIRTVSDRYFGPVHWKAVRSHLGVKDGEKVSDDDKRVKAWRNIIRRVGDRLRLRGLIGREEGSTWLTKKGREKLMMASFSTEYGNPEGPIVYSVQETSEFIRILEAIRRLHFSGYYRALVEGICQGRMVPLTYEDIRNLIDYAAKAGFRWHEGIEVLPLMASLGAEASSA